MDKIEKYIQDLKDSNSTSKRYAAYKLGILGDPRAVDPLVEGLEEHNPFVRSNIIEALGLLGDPKVVEIILKFIDDIDFTVKTSAIEAIGNIAKKNPELDRSAFEKAIPQLIQSLNDDRYLIRHYASISLANIGGEDVDKAITTVMLKGNDTAKEFAIWTIGKLKDITYEEELIDLFKKSDNVNIKRAVIYTLEDMGVEDIYKLFEKAGMDYDKEKDEVFNEEDFNDRLFYNL